MLAAQAGVVARDGHPLRGDPQPLRGLRPGQRRGHRVARPHHERPLAPRRRASPSSLARAVDARERRPLPRGAPSPREDLRELEYASLLHDFGKIGVREKVLRQGQEALRRATRRSSAPRFDYVARSIEADVLSRKVAPARARRRAAREARGARPRARAAQGAISTRACEAGAAPPTSRRCSRAATSRASRRSRKETYVDLRARCAASSTTRRWHCLKVSARLAHAAGVRRDPQPRLAHLHVPLADPLGEGAPRASPSSPARTTSA